MACTWHETRKQLVSYIRCIKTKTHILYMVFKCLVLILDDFQPASQLKQTLSCIFFSGRILKKQSPPSKLTPSRLWDGLGWLSSVMRRWFVGDHGIKWIKWIRMWASGIAYHGPMEWKKTWKLSWHLSGGFLGKRVGCDDNFHEHHYVFRKYRKCGVGESHAIYPVDDRSIELTRSYRNQVQAVVGRNQRLLRSWQRHRNIHVT